MKFKFRNPLARFKNQTKKPLPSTIQSHPSMISREEKRQLFEAASIQYQGEGRIVDAGIFLGGSTMCFGQGIDHNRQKNKILARWPKPIVSFEQALINPGMFKHFDRHGLTVKGKVGDTFEPALRELISPVLDKVDLRIGDITKASWSPDEPIEILFLDVIKTPEINTFVLKTFFPHLIPGKSLVIQQDYFLDLLPYLKVGQEFFADHFEFVAEVGPTAVFRLTKRITAKDVQADPMNFLPLDEKLKLVDRAASRSKNRPRQFMTALSKTHIVGEELGGRKGLEELEALVLKFPDQAPDTTKNQNVINKYNTAHRRMSNTAGMASMHQFLAASLPPQAGRITGYPTSLEKRFLYGLARDYYKGKGQIVDIGTLLGATTVALACGLQDNPLLTEKTGRDNCRIKSFEISTHNKSTLEFLRRQTPVQVSEEKGITSTLKTNLQPFAGVVDLQVKSAKDWDLENSSPIEILHIDRITDINEFLDIYNTAVPLLVRSHGILLLRNYFSDLLPHIKVIHEANAAAFEFVGANKSTGIFKAIENISSESLEKNPVITLSSDEQVNLINQAAERGWSPLQKIQTRFAAIKVLVAANQENQAAELLKSIDQQIGQASLTEIEKEIIARTRSRVEALVTRLSGTS